MSTCPHCENLAIKVAEMTTIVRRLDRELLGNNGNNGKIAETDKRVARLERWRSWLTGAVAAIGALGALVVGRGRLCSIFSLHLRSLYVV